MQNSQRRWWQDGVIYQIYPRSFQDTNADGIGDLAGITSRLDHLVTLGVDALWVSPFYPSPMADFGYDVADYTGVDPIFGTLQDFDILLRESHARRLKLIVDFVPNHTSDRHAWFVESRSSRTSRKREWYLWRDPAPDGGPPNNWMSHFGGPAWTLDHQTGQYFYHSFLRQQPDLNWRNLEVRAAMYDAMLFWLDRGVDGFRMDVLWLLIKDDQYRSNPINPAWTAGSSYGQFLPLYTSDRLETHQIVSEMRALLDTYSERLLIGEIYLPLDRLVTYYGVDPNIGDQTGADMPFNFHLIQTPWNADSIAELIRNYERELPSIAWPNWVLGNHDQPRVASRLGADQARTAAMLLLTLRGTPTLYYGEELGMIDGDIPPDQVQDPAEKNQPGIGMGRDPERTPMLWDSSPGAGFTTGRPWLPIRPGDLSRSVAAQQPEPQSMLNLYRSLLAKRRLSPALQAGIVSDVMSQAGVLMYRRTFDNERLQVVLNLTDKPQQVASVQGQVLLTTLLDGEGGQVAGTLWLEPSEGVLLACD